MENYLMLILSTVLLAVSFALNKVFQLKEGSSIKTGLVYSAIVGFFTAIIFFAMGGFKMEITTYAFVMALLKTISGALYTLIGFKIMSKSNVSDYTFFLMMGGTIVPFIWGVAFLGEDLRILNLLGLALIAFSLFLTNGSSKKDLSVTLMCIAVFFLNGMVSVTSKLHQISPSAIPTNDFVVLSSLINAIICLVASFFFKGEKNKKKMSGISIVIILLVAVVGGVSYVLQLNGAKVLDATICYPIITGGSIIFTSIVGPICFKEKMTKKSAIAILISLVGTCMFVDPELYVNLLKALHL
ncbi:MAG: EamA family transporter [Clostridia bacterium]|nr:EamA family transporter [Clostridia bacterium]